MTDFNTSYIRNELVLDKLRVVSEAKLSKHIIGEESFNQIFSNTIDQMILQLCIHVASKEIEITPSSWWQHFKKDCMPKWFIRRYPIKYNKTKVVVNCDPHRFYGLGNRHVVQAMYRLETDI